MNIKQDRLNHDLKKVYNTIIELLKERGYSDSTISRHISNDLLDFKIDKFLNQKDTNSSTIDIHVYEDNHTFVRFLSPEIENLSTAKFYSILNDNYKFVSDLANIGLNDEIIIILTQEHISDVQKEYIFDIENNYQNVRCLHYKNLIYNIVKSVLVPKHELFKGNKKDLFKQLQIDSDEQLPYISHTDPICKYYNFKINDIICIYRNNTALKTHKVYRVVKPLDLCKGVSI